MRVKIRDEFWVSLKGKMHPTYPGVLDAATEAGLVSLEVFVEQRPAEENGQLAIAVAVAKFADGRVFREIGDCGPKNCSAMIAVHAMRMAATRAKGRALRDALNVGVALVEEITGETESEGTPSATPRPNGRANPTGPAAAAVDAGQPALCQACEEVLTKNQQTISQHKVKMNLCPGCLKDVQTTTVG